MVSNWETLCDVYTEKQECHYVSALSNYNQERSAVQCHIGLSLNNKMFTQKNDKQIGTIKKVCFYCKQIFMH